MGKLKSSNTSVEERGCCFKVMIWFEKEIKKEAFLLFLIRCFYWLQEENTFVLYAFEKKFVVNILLICFYTKAFVVSLGIDVSHIGYCYLMIYIQLCHHLILCDFFGCFKNLILKRIIHLTSVMLHFDICLLLLCTGNSVSWRMHVYRGGEEMERIHPKTKKKNPALMLKRNQGAEAVSHVDGALAYAHLGMISFIITPLFLYLDLLQPLRFHSLSSLCEERSSSSHHPLPSPAVCRRPLPPAGYSPASPVTVTVHRRYPSSATMTRHLPSTVSHHSPRRFAVPIGLTRA